MKNSFMGLREIWFTQHLKARYCFAVAAYLKACPDANLSQPPLRRLKNPELFFFLQALCIGFFIRRLHRFRLFAAGAGINVAILDVNICLLAERAQISTQRGLQFLHVQRVLNAGFDFLEGWNAGGWMLGDFEDDKTLLGANYIGFFSSF